MTQHATCGVCHACSRHFIPFVLLLCAVRSYGVALVSPPPGTTLTSSTTTFAWTAGAGRYLLYIGTTGVGTFNVFNSGYIPNGTQLAEVNNVPTNQLIYVRLWSETGVGTGSFYAYDYTYNGDADSDGILDTVDPNPGYADPMLSVTSTNGSYVLTVLGSGRVASLQAPAIFTNTYDGMTSAEMRDITGKLYAHLKDDFDFIIVASNQRNVPPGVYYGINFSAKNDTAGLGKSMFNSTALFGSAGKLQCAIHLTSISGLSGGPSLHEIAHRWANALTSVPSAVSGHWGYSSVGGQLGGWMPNSLESLGGGEYRARNPRTGAFASFGGNANGGNALPYSEFELYVMGLIPIEHVQYSIDIANDFAWVNAAEGRFSASSIDTRTMTDVIAMDGARVPNHLASQKSFRALYAVLTPTPLTTGEWAAFDDSVSKFSCEGDEGTSSYNFWEATGGRATLAMDGLFDSARVKGFTAIRSIVVSNTASALCRIAFPSRVGAVYRLCRSADLAQWSQSLPVAGTGGDVMLTYNAGDAQRMFFRIEERALCAAPVVGDAMAAVTETPQPCDDGYGENMESYGFAPL